jgi:hypothetical protein
VIFCAELLLCDKCRPTLRIYIEYYCSYDNNMLQKSTKDSVVSMYNVITIDLCSWLRLKYHETKSDLYLTYQFNYIICLHLTVFHKVGRHFSGVYIHIHSVVALDNCCPEQQLVKFPILDTNS